jgi:hypothetical protein
VADYERSTTSTTLAGLPEPVRGALSAHVESALLTVPAGSTAFLTRSKRLRKPGVLARITGTGDKDAEHLTALVLGPTDVLVGIHGEERGTSVLRASRTSTRPRLPSGWRGPAWSSTTTA